MSFSQQIKQSINGDEYFTQQTAVNMIIPYILRGGIEQYGARLISQTACL